MDELEEPSHVWAAILQRSKEKLKRDEQLLRSLPEEEVESFLRTLLDLCHRRIKLGDWLLSEADRQHTWRFDLFRSIKERMKTENPRLENYELDQMAHEELDKRSTDSRNEMYAEAEQLYTESLECAEALELEHDAPLVLITMQRCYDGLQRVCVQNGDNDGANEMVRSALGLRKRLLSYAKDEVAPQREIADEFRKLVWTSGIDSVVDHGLDHAELQQVHNDLSEAQAIYRTLIKHQTPAAEDVHGLIETTINMIEHFPPVRGTDEYYEQLAIEEEAKAATQSLSQRSVERVELDKMLANLREAMAVLD